MGHIIMSIFHEPWFDEALAWLIARDSSLYDIVFSAPHYEGHPALWHLILMPFAKLDMPYELSLSLVSLAFSGTAIALFVYKSPFSKTVRYTLPFTYFLFYQYSVISRPYCMMMLAFVLLALAYEKKDNHPGRFVLSLLFLCLTSAYGIVIAGGICIAWLIEMLLLAGRQSINKNSENGESRNTFRIFFEDYLFKGKKIIFLTGLLVYVLFIAWRIIPAENAYAVITAENSSSNGIVVRLLYTFFGSLSDMFFTNVLYTSGTLNNAEMYTVELIAAVLIGIGLIVLIVKRIGKKTVVLLNFVIPYVLFAGFGGIVYFYYHHVGIILLLLGYCLWILRESESKENTGDKGNVDDKGKIGDKESLNKVQFAINGKNHKIIVFLFIVIPVYWTVNSCIFDISGSYGSGREVYDFLESHGLDDGYSIMADWKQVFHEEDVPTGYSEYDPMFSQYGVNLSPYLKKSYIINSPALAGEDYAYLHKIPDNSVTAGVIEKMIKKGQPDIILGNLDYDKIVGSNYIDYNDYARIYEFEFGNVKKGIKNDAKLYIYLRNDLVLKSK